VKAHLWCLVVHLSLPLKAQCGSILAHFLPTHLLCPVQHNNLEQDGEVFFKETFLMWSSTNNL